MTNIAKGHCLCGYVSYEYSGQIGPANYCHCEDCRRCTGSAFNIGVRLDVAGFRIVSGSPKAFTKRGDSGFDLTRHFCPECGSPIYTSSPRHPQYVYVKAGTLDDPKLVKPTHQNWVISAVPWGKIGETVPAFAKGTGSTSAQPSKAADDKKRQG
jgi:hypothetical protein